MFKNKREVKGITLVALVITIIILLILAGISIATLTGSGLFERARLAEQEYKNEQSKEEGILGDYENKINSYITNSNRELENEREIKFYKGNNGFNVTHGEMQFNSYGLETTTFPTDNVVGNNYVAQCEKIENGNLGPKFEISAQIYFNNETTKYMGNIEIKLFKNNENKCSVYIGDAWVSEDDIAILASFNGQQVVSTKKTNTNNGSGRYAIVGDGKKVYFYWGKQLLGSIDCTENISYDKIGIDFQQYIGYSVPPIYLESLYIGEPLYYKTLIEQN